MLSGFTLPPTERLLLEGGDARIALDPDNDANRYGCSPLPDPALLAFGSSTATGISEAGFAAADRLRARLLASAHEPPAQVYVRELNRVRQELVRLCGLDDISGLEVVVAASGTDLHAIAGKLAVGADATPTLAVMLDAAETGSYVPAALSADHAPSRAALDPTVRVGAAIFGGGAMELVTVPIRAAEGAMRSAEAIDDEFESLVAAAVAAGQHVLLILVDVSKTGCLVPSPILVAALKERWPDRVDVLVDACQFRISAQTLAAYLVQDFMVAITGSKFLTGPSFAGALFIPPGTARRLRQQPLSQALLDYSMSTGGPSDSNSVGSADELANFGLLLRWEAALEELRAFRALPQAQVKSFLKMFARAIKQRLMSDPLFELLQVPGLARHPWRSGLGADDWDLVPTIFPFLLFHGGATAKRPLSRDETLRVYRLLQDDLSDHRELHASPASVELARLRCQFGQPVACGVRAGVPVSALRLCVSARLVVEACAQGGGSAGAVIERALVALDKTVLVVRSLEAFSAPAG